MDKEPLADSFTGGLGPLKKLAFAIYALGTLGFSLPAHSQPVATQKKTQLHVSLFPYLPDTNGDCREGLRLWIEREFEKRNPNIDLVLSKMDENADFYDSGFLIKQLCSGIDVLEVDTILLDEVKAEGVIMPWPKANLKKYNYHASCGSLISDADGDQFAVPHWLCGHFVVSRSNAVTQSKTAEDLVSNLQAAGSTAIKLSSDFTGSWNLPCRYLDAWQDNHPAEDSATALTIFLDPASVASLKKVVDCVARNGTNPGLDETFKDNTKAQVEFASEKSVAFLGYSEGLAVITQLRMDSAPLYVQSVPLGNGSKPILFNDGLVLRDKSSVSVQEAAVKFANFINDPEIASSIVLSKEAKSGTQPRYLLPANLEVFAAPGVVDNPLYKQLRQEVDTGVPFPRGGVLERRRGMVEALKRELKK